MQETTIQQMKMANNFFADIESGQKTATIRKGRRDIKLAPMEFESTDPIMSRWAGTIPDDSEKHYKAVQVDITEVTYKKFGDLTTEDAQIDNYSDVAQLKQVMLGFYPDLTDEDEVTIIRFQK